MSTPSCCHPVEFHRRGAPTCLPMRARARIRPRHRSLPWPHAGRLGPLRLVAFPLLPALELGGAYLGPLPAGHGVRGGPRRGAAPPAAVAPAVDSPVAPKDAVARRPPPAHCPRRRHHARRHHARRRRPLLPGRASSTVDTPSAAATTPVTDADAATCRPPPPRPPPSHPAIATPAPPLPPRQPCRHASRRPPPSPPPLVRPPHRPPPPHPPPPLPQLQTRPLPPLIATPARLAATTPARRCRQVTRPCSVAAPHTASHASAAWPGGCVTQRPRDDMLKHGLKDMRSVRSGRQFFPELVDICRNPSAGCGREAGVRQVGLRCHPSRAPHPPPSVDLTHRGGPHPLGHEDSVAPSRRAIQVAPMVVRIHARNGCAARRGHSWHGF